MKRAEATPHEVDRVIHERCIYPAHAARTESPEFKASKAQLRKDGHYKCFICGATEDLQCHHFACEWALWNDADPAKVLALCEKLDPYGYAAKMKGKPLTTPDDIRNQLVLCGKHHVGVGTGIHEMTFPIWIAQKISKPNKDPVPQLAKPASVTFDPEKYWPGINQL